MTHEELLAVLDAHIASWMIPEFKALLIVARELAEAHAPSISPEHKGYAGGFCLVCATVDKPCPTYAALLAWAEGMRA